MKKRERWKMRSGGKAINLRVEEVTGIWGQKPRDLKLAAPG